MSISLASLTKAKAVLPPRVLVYAPPKVGKTTFAAEWPNPVFLQLEDGTSGDLELTTFGLLESYDDFMSGLNALCTEEHDFKTVVVDTIDALEPLIWHKVCSDNNWNSIEEPGFGKGYVEAAGYWAKVLKATDYLRRSKGMNILFLGHSDVSKFDPPGMDAYSRYELRVHKRASALLMDDMDIITFMNFRTEIKSQDQGFGKTRTHAEGGGTRWMYLEHRPAHEAGNRYGLDAEQPRIVGRTVQQWAAAGVPIAGLEKTQKQ